MAKIGAGLTREEAVALLSVGDEARLRENLQLIGSKGEESAARHGYGDDIARHLSHTSPEVVAAAAEALGGLGLAGAKYADFVSVGLSHQSPKVVAASAAALGHFGTGAAKKHAGALAKVAESDDENAKIAAIQALGELGAAEHAELVGRLLAADNVAPAVAAAAREALGGMGDAGVPFAATIAQGLSSEGARLSALRALGGLGPDAAAPFASKIVESCLESVDFQTRAEAVAVLGAMPRAAAGSAAGIAKRLTHKAPGARAAAAMALGGLGEEGGKHADGIGKLLHDDAEDVAWMALQVGGACGRAPPAMRKPKCAALLALGTLGGSGAEQASKWIRSVAERLEDEDWEARCCAIEALASLAADGRQYGEQVANMLCDDTYPCRAKACTALGLMRAVDQADRLPEMLKDSSPGVRAEAATALGLLGVEDAAPQVVDLFTDQAAQVRAAAAGALACLGAGGQSYASVVATKLEDPKPIVRCAVLGALARMGEYGEAFQDDMAACLQDPSSSVRAEAASALRLMGVEVGSAIES